MKCSDIMSDQNVKLAGHSFKIWSDNVRWLTVISSSVEVCAILWKSNSRVTIHAYLITLRCSFANEASLGNGPQRIMMILSLLFLLHIDGCYHLESSFCQLPNYLPPSDCLLFSVNSQLLIFFVLLQEVLDRLQIEVTLFQTQLQHLYWYCYYF